jgi:hypothetical protein
MHAFKDSMWREIWKFWQNFWHLNGAQFTSPSVRPPFIVTGEGWMGNAWLPMIFSRFTLYPTALPFRFQITFLASFNSKFFNFDQVFFKKYPLHFKLMFVLTLSKSNHLCLIKVKISIVATILNNWFLIGKHFALAPDIQSTSLIYCLQSPTNRSPLGHRHLSAIAGHRCHAVGPPTPTASSPSHHHHRATRTLLL